ncbi:hypothetical protein DT594_10555 [Halopseudomonas laoshanensis]|jgi:hypothetical protein|uniref:Secreted protein n=2 Tax=Halopseudomonas TaxID=2901189 RepID=A0A7V7GUV1_9GAMM|nr:MULTISPECIES: hypothetical protein [Halopseudomonas]MBQ0742545.1 hypothetical protein [Pseudomonas sp.]WOD11819.1 hypothetical protein RPW65_02805 [Pseudomonas sp. NyZ704]KAA0695263.1 hypothetical protein DT594_10555 [Halopseudomonas laoshanensis]PCC98771.1 hypothetical protein CO192_14055 [Halopseudomonas pelagia]QFY58391.1 hypothetical protein EAO82_19725 [Halopseudomonas pelagia]|tara:strand:+ start:186 stop:401 length:216 start_codon:yes stop_codon:yes gene_type:complete
MKAISKLAIPFVIALMSANVLAEDGSDRALSGVSSARAPQHIQSDRDNSYVAKQEESKRKEEAKASADTQD